jgi:hypothetical protein
MLNIYKNRSNNQYKTASILKDSITVKITDTEEEKAYTFDSIKKAADYLAVSESDITLAEKNDTLINDIYSVNIERGRTQVYFKYRKITQEDISKVQYLSGLRTSSEEFVISTTTQFEFDVLEHQVNIDNIKYKILDVYREDNLHGEGMFRKEHIKTLYLRIGK